MNDELRIADWKDRILFFLGRRQAFRVEGSSMSPALNDGDAVLIKTGSKAAVGDIVLGRHPFKQSVQLLKRVTEIDDDGRFFLTGDNVDESTDSRTLGAITQQNVLGTVICKLK